jgi:GAF domain-containing protein
MEKNKAEFSEWLSLSLHKIRQDLGMETAIASFIKNDVYTIVAVDSVMEGVFSAGQEFPLQDTYCRAVAESKQAVKYNHVASIKTMLQHPVYQAVKLESYIAAPIMTSNGRVIGTINITSLDPHKPSFTDEEESWVKTLADAISEQANTYQELADSL